MNATDAKEEKKETVGRFPRFAQCSRCPRFALSAVDLAINARARVTHWKVCRVKGLSPATFLVWGHHPDKEALWEGLVPTSAFFPGYYAAMNHIAVLSAS